MTIQTDYCAFFSYKRHTFSRFTQFYVSQYVKGKSNSIKFSGRDNKIDGVHRWEALDKVNGGKNN